MAVYETQEIKDLIPEDIRSVLWFMLQELDVPTPNHSFDLSVTEIKGTVKQKVIHTQKNTVYRREFSFKCTTPITISVYVVGFNKDNWLMLLQP